MTIKKTSAPTADIVEQAVEKVLRRKKTRITGTAMPMGTIVRADALGERGVATLADGSVDLFLFSPPYAEQRKQHYPSIPEKDYPAWILRLMGAIRPKLTPKGSVLIIAREHLRDGQVSDVWLRTRLALREQPAMLAVDGGVATSSPRTFARRAVDWRNRIVQI